MDTVCQTFSNVVSLSGLIKPNVLLVLSQTNLLLMLATVCSVLCNIRASVDALCRDGADHVSRDPCTNSPVSRPRSINWA